MLKLQYFGHLMRGANSLGKTLMLGKIKGRKRGDRGWDGWMASLTQWTWVWASSRRWWRTRSLACCSPEGHRELDLCHPLLLLPSIFPRIRVFYNKSALRISWPKYLSVSFNFSISPSNEYLGLISFRIYCFDILAVQGALRSLLQHSNFLWPNSYTYMTTGKTIALTLWIFVSKVTSLLFNMLSRLVIAFLPRSKWTSETTID